MPWIGGHFVRDDYVAADFDVGRWLGDAPPSPCSASAAPDICPTLDECHAQIIASLPRGRAWNVTVGDVRWRFWRAVADVVAWTNARICQARDEFFCATMSETRDVWMQTYGFPDACDPYARICDKVSAIGGQTCAYLVAMASRAGYAVECIDMARVGAEALCAEAGCAEAAAQDRGGGYLVLRVSAYRSPALGTTTGTPVDAGLIEAGQEIYCGPDLSGLRCLMDRIAPAHLEIIYVMH